MKNLLALLSLSLLVFCSCSKDKEVVLACSSDEIRYQIDRHVEDTAELLQRTELSFDTDLNLQALQFTSIHANKAYPSRSTIRTLSEDDSPSTSAVRMEVNAYKSGYSFIYRATYVLEGAERRCTQASRTTLGEEGWRDYRFTYLELDGKTYLSGIEETDRNTAQELYRLTIDYSEFAQNKLHLKLYLQGELYNELCFEIQPTPGISFPDRQWADLGLFNQHLELLYGAYLGSFDYVIVARKGQQRLDNYQATYEFNKWGYPSRLTLSSLDEGGKKSYYTYTYCKSFFKAWKGGSR